MLKFENIFKPTAASVVKLSLSLRILIGVLASASYVQNKPGLSFGLLVAGAILDFVLQMLPQNVTVKNGANTVLIVVGLVAGAALVGCKTLRPTSERQVTDSTTVTYKKQAVEVLGASVLQTINTDSLFAVWRSKLKQFKQDSALASAAGLPIPKPPVLAKRTVTDTQTKAQLTYWIDQYGKLQVGCESKDQTIQVLVAETNRLRQEIKTTPVIVKETPLHNWIIIGALGGLLVLALVKLFFKN